MKGVKQLRIIAGVTRRIGEDAIGIGNFKRVQVMSVYHPEHKPLRTTAPVILGVVQLGGPLFGRNLYGSPVFTLEREVTTHDAATLLLSLGVDAVIGAAVLTQIVTGENTKCSTDKSITQYCW